MNIKITYNWLLDYLETNASPYDLQKYLSLCGPSIERVEKREDDYIFDIEVTSNRVDAASVFGIAQEAQAILSQFGKKAVLKNNPLTQYSFKNIEQSPNKLPLNIVPFDQRICSRFTAIVLSGVKIGESPEIMKKRLQWCDIQSINNIVDISNYLMLSLGQPTHMFDYDRIAGQIMKLRESQKGESLITLDGRSFKLPGGDIVIEDKNELIDLCGIMGGLNSSITPATKNIVFFVQTYNKRKIRKTSMTTGQRTIAATYFEKGLDEERVEPTMVYGLELLKLFAGALPASQIYDIYPKPFTPSTIKVTQKDIVRVMGVDIDDKKITDILKKLGFKSEIKGKNILVSVPSFREDDIKIKEDIAEEVARVYGYHNLPNVIQSTVYVKQPKDVDMLFELQKKIKYFFKYRGYSEIMNYSMISENTIKKLDGNPEEHLMLSNTISEEIKYMRTSLMQSLIKNIADNQGKKEALNLFEIAKVYLPKKDELPDEKFRLSIATTTSFYELKGLIELLLEHLNIKYSFSKSTHPFLSSGMQAQLIIDKNAGVIGKLKSTYKEKFGIKDDIYLAEIDIAPLILHTKQLPTYISPTQYAVVKFDVNYPITPQLTFENIKKTAFASVPTVSKVEFVNTYNNVGTVSIYFNDITQNITEDRAKKDLEIIMKNLGIKNNE